MTNFPKKLSKKLATRKLENAFRVLPEASNLIDFSSNDYLGFSNAELIFSETQNILKERSIYSNGATGSRLISGNSLFYTEVEKEISTFHNSEEALVFNSGYDANLGFFSSVPQRGDIVLFDEYIHASIRDGIRLSTAKAFKFKHNDLKNLKKYERYDNSIYTISLKKLDINTHNLRGKWGFFYEYNINDLNKIKSCINNKYQTLTYFGLNKNVLRDFILNNQLEGIDRVVPVGQALDINFFWDGYDLNKILSRVVDIK